MEKEKVLVRDNKGVFLKMFKRRFKDEFDFSEELFSLTNENYSKKFNRSIFVVYDKTELLEFLKIEKKGLHVLVCLFNKQLYGSLSFLNDMSNLIVLDNAKTRSEIISELKSHFKKNLIGTKKQEEVFSSDSIFETRFQNLYKAMFFLM
ncbi:hypothetical protein [Flavobacterium daemonense]|uniref:hypothetical protein n=1 Tax=Flavobacterium daemonense TaxID=1393049 RepID=UPI0011855A22|nr:hypothetical protein [Flavobacterium daemonense]KAF2329819.1 hypothetical protein FND99_15860 [Flavobacterium daemonense]